MYLFFRLTCEQKQHQFCSFDYLKKAINQRFFQITGVMSKKDMFFGFQYERVLHHISLK